jgi:predicted permease
VTTLLLARSSKRSAEFQLRAALGAGRTALLRDVLAEALLLAGAALLLALPLASAGMGWMQQQLLDVDEGAAYWVSFAIDGRIVLVAAVFALLSAAVSGVLPAWRGSQAALTELRGSGRGMLSSSGRLMGALVIFEVALCLALLTGGTVLQRHLDGMINKPIGAHVEDVLTARIALFSSRYPDLAARAAYQQRLRNALQADPQLRNATLSEGLPAISSNWTFASRNLPAAGEDPGTPIYESAVDPEFFSLLSITLESGRLLSAADTLDSEPVAVIDRRLASALFAGETAIGRRLRLAEDPQGVWRTVVGVIAPVHMDDLDDEERPAVFTPMAQRVSGFFSILLRPEGIDMTRASTALERLVAGLDGDTPAYMLSTLSKRIEGGRFGPTLLAELFGAIAVLALLLAATGLYGVLAYVTEQRTREFGLKRALGASRLSLVGSALRGSFWQFGLGALIGLPLAVMFAGTLAAVIGSAQSLDHYAIVLASGFLLIACVLAAGVPAWRAMRCDPLTALRAD